jgi:ubiquitin C-terminal hydrolase
MTMSVTHKSTLEASIEDHLSEVKLDGLYTCEKCKGESRAKIRHSLVMLPHFIVFHIKRFDSIFNKIRSTTRYSSVLELRK